MTLWVQLFSPQALLVASLFSPQSLAGLPSRLYRVKENICYEENSGPTEHRVESQPPLLSLLQSYFSHSEPWSLQCG